MSAPPTGTFNSGTSHSKQGHEALTEASLPSQPQDTEETRSVKKIDKGELNMSKLPIRGAGILAAFSEKRISITDIEFTEKSSQDGGTFADVAVATLVKANRIAEGEKRVAVKKFRFIINRDLTEEKFLALFANELRLLDGLSHPNIVKIIGFVEDMENCIAWLVFPWEDNGNLRQFLRSGAWELPERVSLIYDVAVGLEYLHTCQSPICHGDLKSLNILVTSSNRAVITDFGSARIVEPGTTSVPQPAASASQTSSKRDESTGIKLTVSNNTLTLTGPACSLRWAPPEYFNENALGLESDIWALGWIAWEAITDRHPFEEIDSEVHVPIKIIEGQLPRIYDHDQLSEIGQLCGIMLKCWKPDPRERLSATECRKAITWIPQIIPSPKGGDRSTIPSAALLLQIGDIHRLQGRCHKASTTVEQALEIARSTGDQITLGALLVQLGILHLRRSYYVDAAACFTEALAISRSIGSALLRATALSELGRLKQEQYMYIEAEESYAEALAIYKSSGSELGRANTLLRLGNLQQRLTKSIEAETTYTEALAIYRRIGYDQGQAYVLNGLGNVWRDQNQNVKAEKSYAEAVLIFKTIGDIRRQADALNRLGDARIPQSKYIEAEAAYAEALAIYESIADRSGRAKALKQLGDVWREQSRHIEAEASYVKAVVIYKSIGSVSGRADALYGLGAVRARQSKFAEAEASFAEVLAICNAHGSDVHRKRVLCRLGNVQRRQSKYTEAEVSYAEALAICTINGDELGRVDSSLQLAKIRMHQERFDDVKVLIEDATSISVRLDYTRGIESSKKLREKVLNTEISSFKRLASALSHSTLPHDSSPPASLPVNDESLP